MLTIYTNAPESYDYRGESSTVEPKRILGHGMDGDKPIRAFRTDEQTAKFQIPRYQSGLYFVTTDEQEMLERTQEA